MFGAAMPGPVSPGGPGIAGAEEGAMHIDPKDMARVRLTLRKAVSGWLFDPNVTLVGFGWREREGQLIKGERVIRIHVREKCPEGPKLEAAIERGVTGDRIPPKIDDIPTDVVKGIYRPHQWWGGWGRRTANPRARRADLLQGGISISNERHYTYGTLGGLVIDRATSDEMILSNWHVLAGDWGARPGRRIYQPGRRDGGTRADTVATLTRDAMSVNLDAAVARLTGSRRLINRQLGLGPVKGVRRAELGMEVIKSGRKTEVTFGRVTVIEGTARIPYWGLERIIRNVVTIEPHRFYGEVSAGGDSGSWWLDRVTRQAIGLHFAGGNRPEHALAIDMQSVLDALGADIVPRV